MGLVYNFQIVRGVASNRSLLSAGSGVDLWSEDDGSGRQQWVVEPVGNGESTIAISRGTAPGRTYLGIVPGGTLVDLVATPQSWLIVPVITYRDDLGIPGLVWIRPASDPDAFLSCRADGNRVDIWRSDDGSGRQRWQMQGPFWVD
jgi:hypothetical protein